MRTQLQIYNYMDHYAAWESNANQQDLYPYPTERSQLISELTYVFQNLHFGQCDPDIRWITLLTVETMFVDMM